MLLIEFYLFDHQLFPLNFLSYLRNWKGKNQYFLSNSNFVFEIESRWTSKWSRAPPLSPMSAQCLVFWNSNRFLLHFVNMHCISSEREKTCWSQWMNESWAGKKVIWARCWRLMNFFWWQKVIAKLNVAVFTHFDTMNDSNCKLNEYFSITCSWAISFFFVLVIFVF